MGEGAREGERGRERVREREKGGGGVSFRVIPSHSESPGSAFCCSDPVACCCGNCNKSIFLLLHLQPQSGAVAAMQQQLQLLLVLVLPCLPAPESRLACRLRCQQAEQGPLLRLRSRSPGHEPLYGARITFRSRSYFPEQEFAFRRNSNHRLRRQGPHAGRPPERASGRGPALERAPHRAAGRDAMAAAAVGSARATAHEQSRPEGRGWR